MAIRTIDDSILQGIAEEIQAKDGGGQMTVDEMPGRIQAIPSADPYKKVNEIYSGTVTYFKSASVLIPPIGSTGGNHFTPYGNIRYFSVKNSGGYYYNDWLTRFGRNLVGLRWTAILGSPDWIQDGLFTNSFLHTIIFLNTEIPTLTGALYGVNILNLKIYIRDSVLSSWKTATNWSTYADRTFGFSEAPIYNNATTYEIGDVCQYNNKFYAYSKEDLTSSTGNPPTGTTADNDYWEYVADIEVI